MSYLNLIHDRLFLINRILLRFTFNVGEPVKIIEFSPSTTNDILVYPIIYGRKLQKKKKSKKNRLTWLYSCQSLLQKLKQIVSVFKLKKSSKNLPMDNLTTVRQVNDESNVNSLLRVYTLLENVCENINSAYGIHIIVISIMKFTTLTTLLYFCCMIIIKYGIHMTEVSIFIFDGQFFFCNFPFSFMNYIELYLVMTWMPKTKTS